MMLIILSKDIGIQWIVYNQLVPFSLSLAIHPPVLKHMRAYLKNLSAQQHIHLKAGWLLTKKLKVFIFKIKFSYFRMNKKESAHFKKLNYPIIQIVIISNHLQPFISVIVSHYIFPVFEMGNLFKLFRERSRYFYREVTTGKLFVSVRLSQTNI